MRLSKINIFSNYLKLLIFNKKLVWLLFILFFSTSLLSQNINKRDSFLFKTEDKYNRVTFYSAYNNSLAVFEKNLLWYTDLKGKKITDPVKIIKRDGDVWYPRLSPSGKNIFFFYPSKEFVGPDDEGSYDRIGIYNTDSSKTTGFFRLNISDDLTAIQFINDTVVKYETKSSMDDVTGHYWDLKKNIKDKLQLDDEGKGMYDLQMYKDLFLVIARSKDSLLFIGGDTAKTKMIKTVLPLELKINIKTFFTAGYPFIILQNEKLKTTSFYKIGDTSFVLVQKINELPLILSAGATEKECYIIAADTLANTSDRIYFLNTSAGKKIFLEDYNLKFQQPIFNVYPQQNFFTVSHPYSGRISAFELTAAKKIWSVQPEHWTNSLVVGKKKEENYLQNQLFEVQMKQGTTNALQSFYNEEKDELIQVQEDKIVFIDVESGGQKNWIPFLPNEGGIYNIRLSPDKKNILFNISRVANSGEDNYYQYPDVFKVFNIDSVKVILSVESGIGAPQVKFLGSDHLYIETAADYDNEAARFYLYDLKTHNKKIITAPKGFNNFLDGIQYKNGFYFLLGSSNTVLLQNEDGKEIFKKKFTEKSAKPSGYFSDGVPYLFIAPDAFGNIGLAYKFFGDSVKFIRNTPGKNIITSYGSTNTLHILYSKNIKRKKVDVIHNRLQELVTGKDRLVDSVNNYEAIETKIFPSKRMLVKEQAEVLWYDLNTGFEFRKVGDESRNISSIAYSPDGRYLAAANPIGKVMLWDLGTGKETRVLKVEKSGYITKLAFSGNGAYLAASSGDIWEVATGKNIVSVTDPAIWNVNSIAYANDGKTIVSGGACVITWDGVTGEKIRFNIHPDEDDFDKENLCFNPHGCIKDDYALMVHSTAFHPDSKQFAVGAANGEVAVFAVDSNKVLASKKFYGFTPEDRKIYELKYTRDGKNLLAVHTPYLYKLSSNSLNVEDSLAVSPGEKILAIDVGYDDEIFAVILQRANTQVVQIRSLKNLSLVKEFTATGASFNMISFSPNKKHIATASDDGFCTVWNIEEGKPQLYLNTIGDYGNIMVTPDNYYMASKSALAGVTFKKDDEFYSFDQFDLYFNRPDIVLERLGYASPELLKIYEQAYQKRLKKLSRDISDSVPSLAVPELELVNRSEIPFVTQTVKQQLNFLIKDTIAESGILEVLINANPVFSKKINGNENIPVNVDLSSGKNNIEAVFINDRGLESRKQSISVNYVPAKPVASKVWYIGVGVSNYKDSTMNLQYAAKDIRDIAKAVKKKYPNAVIDTLINATATKENILAIKQKLMQTTINDKVIISFSGHGLISDSLDWYFATADVNFSKPQEKGLLYDDLENILTGIPARQKLLLLDACHSGELDKASDRTIVDKEVKMQDEVVEAGARSTIKKKSAVGLQTSFELMQELFANLSKGNGASVVSAAGGREYAFESDKWQNGVFTYSLLNALNDKATDADEDGKITVQELKKVIFDSVKTLTGNRQKPTSRVEATDDWVIWQ